jgi:hypothetical protein
VRGILQQTIEARGGLPRERPGMTGTCHARQASDDDRRGRARLDAYGRVALSTDGLPPAACDASDIMP